MTKIVAAYIAHGRRRADYNSDVRQYPVDDKLQLEWQRIFCLFSLIHRFSDEETRPRMILIADHHPPAIQGRLLRFYFDRMNVEFYFHVHFWRPDYEVAPAEYYIFDALEKLEQLTANDDQIAMFGGHSLAVHPLDDVFQSISQNEMLFVENSVGDMQEAHIDAIRERTKELRRFYDAPFPPNAIHAVSKQFLGFTHERLGQLMEVLRPVFALNLVRASRGEDFFGSAAELLAVLFAKLGFHHPPSWGLSGHAAAIPDDFAIVRLAEVPVIIPGYGREPDISNLFSKLIPDRFANFEKLEPNLIRGMMENEYPPIPISHRLRNWVSEKFF